MPEGQGHRIRLTLRDSRHLAGTRFGHPRGILLRGFSRAG
jgi:hypothetical protein